MTGIRSNWGFSWQCDVRAKRIGIFAAHVDTPIRPRSPYTFQKYA